MRKWVTLDKNNIIIGSFESDIEQQYATEVFTESSSETLCNLIFVNSHTLKEDITNKAIAWRNSELLRTDSLILLPDYPNKEALVVYRQELRDWTSSKTFPDTRPQLASEIGG